MAWLGAPYPDLGERATKNLPHFETEAISPLYDACTVAELTEANARYLRRACYSNCDEGETFYEPLFRRGFPSYPLPATQDFIANEFAGACPVLPESTLCRDIRSKARIT